MSKAIVFALASCVTMGSINPISTPYSMNLNTCKNSFIRKTSSTRTTDFNFNMSNTSAIKRSNDIVVQQNTIKNENEQKKNDLYVEALDIFEGFRNLTKEEEEAYLGGLKKISKPTGRKLTL